MTQNETNKADPQKVVRPYSENRRGMIIGLYLLVGPPIGAAIIVALLWVAMFLSFVDGGQINIDGADLSNGLGVLAVVSVLAAPVSYFFGGIQALVTGIIIACFSDKDGKFGYGLALLAPVAPCVAAAFVLDVERGEPNWGAFFGVVGVLASLIVRLLFRQRFSKSAGA